jgi:hypothetical protein
VNTWDIALRNIAVVENLKKENFNMNRIQKHRDICQYLNKVYEQKNHDYGNSFGETFDKLGIISAVTRISDKYNRLCSLATKPEEERKVKDESITDTLMDMANYCIMTIIEMKCSQVVAGDNDWDCK